MEFSQFLYGQEYVVPFSLTVLFFVVIKEAIKE